MEAKATGARPDAVRAPKCCPRRDAFRCSPIRADSFCALLSVGKCQERQRCRHWPQSSAATSPASYLGSPWPLTGAPISRHRCRLRWRARDRATATTVLLVILWGAIQSPISIIKVILFFSAHLLHFIALLVCFRCGCHNLAAQHWSLPCESIGGFADPAQPASWRPLLHLQCHPVGCATLVVEATIGICKPLNRQSFYFESKQAARPTALKGAY